MESKEIGRLVVSRKKNLQWTVFKLSCGSLIKVLVKNHKSGNPRLAKLIIDCPKSIDIYPEENDNSGNH